MARNLQVFYHQVRGLYFQKTMQPDNIEFAMDYQPGPGDRILLTPEKCGTWWTTFIALHILHSGRLPKSKPDYNAYTLERDGKLVVDREVGPNQDPGVTFMSTHLSFTHFAYNPSAKYLMVLRNPKDVCVSWYHLMKDKYAVDINKYVQNIWLSGQRMPYEDYFEATLSYWSHRMSGNCTVITYEEMLANPRDSIVRIASFLGHKYVDRLYDRCGDTATHEILLDRIIRETSFETMKSTQSTGNTHFRKGIVGDWRDVLSKNESDLIDQKVRDKWLGTGLETLWEREMKL